MPFEKKKKDWVRTRDIHASAQIIFHVSETIGECECQLRNRVGAGFRDMITGNETEIEIPDVFFNEVLLHIAIRRKANSVEKMQVFWA